ncbi:MAG: N-acetyltransferase [Caldilinea sp. CFX5]|nr:N-acetyltransferase [Caldilinea sp. CFX5]
MTSSQTSPGQHTTDEASNRFDFSTFPTLTTERLVLREVVAADAADVFVFRSDYEVQKYNGKPMQEVAEAVSLIDWLSEKFKAREFICWGIALRADNRVLGLLSFHNISLQQRSVAIGYDLARSHWGQGIATEAVDATLRFGFRQMGLHRIEVNTCIDDLNSVRLVERLGFQREGVRREATLEDDGLYHGIGIFGLLAREYKRYMDV